MVSRTVFPWGITYEQIRVFVGRSPDTLGTTVEREFTRIWEDRCQRERKPLSL